MMFGAQLRLIVPTLPENLKRPTSDDEAHIEKSKKIADKAVAKYDTHTRESKPLNVGDKV